MRLFESCKHPQRYFKQQFSMLISLCACLPFAKKINHLIYDVYNIVEDVVMLNDYVNCLFAVCKLSI